MIRRANNNVSIKPPVAKSKLGQPHKSNEAVKVMSKYQKGIACINLAINNLNNKTIVDLELLYNLKNTLKEKTPFFEKNLVELYQEVKINLPELVLKRFQEVQNFHASITQNSRLYLQSEMSSIEKRIKQHKIERRKLEQKRHQLMKILQSDGLQLERQELPVGTGQMKKSIIIVGESNDQR